MLSASAIVDFQARVREWRGRSRPDARRGFALTSRGEPALKALTAPSGQDGPSGNAAEATADRSRSKKSRFPGSCPAVDFKASGGPWLNLLWLCPEVVVLATIPFVQKVFRRFSDGFLKDAGYRFRAPVMTLPGMEQ